MKLSVFTILLVSITASLHGALGAGQCGRQAGGALCPNGLCCSGWGFCGTTPPYCGDGCQSQCPQPSPPPPPFNSPPPPSPPPPSPPPSPPSPGGDGVASIISSALFDELLLHRNDPPCPARGFYRYEDFIAAAKAFVGFGTTGDLDTQKREIAAFLAQTSHETTGGWDGAPGGRFAWGYGFKEEVGATWDYCVPSTQWPCAPGKKYFGRGPIQISYNYNYGPAGVALGADLLNNPDLVATDPTISFETALWFWMTPQSPKPSCHDVITDRWTPSNADTEAGRLRGYGVITNIINGGLECGHGTDSRVQDRIGFYKRYCDIFGISTGDNLDCNNQRPFNWGRAVE